MNVLILENINQSAISLYEKNKYNVTHLKTSLSETELIQKITDINVLCIRSKTKITKNVIDNAPKLEVIGCYCIGTNQVDMEYCRSKGITVINSPYMNTRSVAELTISEIIALSRKLGDKNNELHNGIWNKSHIGCYEVRGKVLGIIGYGHVGSQLSILAQNIGMNVIYYDILNVLSLGNAIRCSSMTELLHKSDFVSLHVPLTSETENLIGTKEIYNMKKGSYLLNLSRGKVVDVEAVRSALLNNHLAGCSFDVYPEEPKKNTNDFVSVLQNCPNTILTPHIGGATEEAQHSIGIDVTSKIIHYLTFGDTFETVNFPKIQVHTGERHKIYIKNIHKNHSGVMSKINNIFEKLNINITKQYVDTHKDIGYCITVFDFTSNLYKISLINTTFLDGLLESINQLDTTIHTSLYIDN